MHLIGDDSLIVDSESETRTDQLIDALAENDPLPPHAATDIVVVAPMPTYKDPIETLHSILSAMTAADDEIHGAKVDDIDLMENGKTKVDNYKHFIDFLDSREFYLKNKIKEYQTALDAVEELRDEVKSKLLKALQENGFEKFTGHQYVVKVQRNSIPSTEITAGAATRDHMAKFDAFIRIKYEWDATAIKLGIQAGDPLAGELGKITQGYHTRFILNPDAKQDKPKGKTKK